MKHEFPQCDICGQRHGWNERCGQNDCDRGALTGPLAALGLILAVCLFAGLSATCHGAVVAYNNTFTATEPFEFSLDPSLKTDIVFSLNSESQWTIGSNTAHNKNTHFHAYEGILAQLLPGWETFFEVWPDEAVLSGLWWKANGVPVYVAVYSNPEDDGRIENIHHGYIHLAVNPDNSLTIHDWAFENIGDTPIIVGSVPEPATVFILSALAALLLLRRNRTDRNHETALPS